MRTPGRNRYEPTKVETRTVKNDELKSTGMRDTLTDGERDALEKNREVTDDDGIRDSRRPMTEDEGKDLVDEANKRLAKLVPGITVRRGELSDDAKAMGARAQFNRSNGEVLIGTNADYIDAVHEIGAHAVRLWAEKNCPELFRKTLEYALNAPKEIKEFVFREYDDFNGDALLDEIFAHRFMKEHGEEFRKMLEKSANRTWWGKVKDGVREMYRRIAMKNKVDLKGLDKDADAEKWMDAIAEQIVAGKRFGGRNAVTGEMDGVRRSIPGNYDDNDHKWVDGEMRFARTGVRNDGIEVFSTNDNVSKMTNAERIKEFERLMREEYRGRTARFMIDGNPIYARFEGDDIRKIVHGDKKSSPHNFKAKMKVGASGDIFDLVENSRYRKPKDESGKTTDAHDGVDRWDYFDKTVQIDDGMYDVHIDVRRRKNDSANMPDEFIYNVYLTHSNKKADHQSLNRASENGIAYGSGYRPTAHGYGESTFKSVPQNGGEVNTGRTVKESTGDNGVRYSRGPRHPNPNPGNFMDKEESAKDKYLRNFSDRYDPVRTVVVDALKAGGMSDKAAKDYAYADADSPYHAERVQTGLAERDLTGLRSIQKSFENILKLKNVGITNEEIGEFMYATYAPDRNAQKLRDHGVTDGAGMSDADAQSILAQFQRDGKTANLQRAADVLWKINDEYGLDFLENAQLLDHDSVQRLKTAYGKHYTPLRDDFTEDGVDYNSRRAPDATAFKGAVGRFSKAENPVAFMLMQGMDNIVRAHENMTRLNLAEFVRKHPEMGRVREATQDDMKNGGAGIVFFRENATAKNGNTYNRRMAIELFGKRGNDIASSVNGTTVVNAPKQVQALSRWWASFATQLSPTFSMRNFIKDTVEVAYDTIATMGARPALSFLRRQAAMMPLWNRETRRVFKEFRETGKVTGTSQVAQDFQKFIDAGGLIGGGGAREGYAKMTQDFDDITKQLSKAGNTARSIGRVWDAYKDWVSGINENIETLTRFNNFANRLHANGGDAARAAIDSREGSTDFNMHGDQRWMNSVWMFSNSILGGSMRAAKSLAFGKYGRNLAVGMLAMGMLEELANSAANSDEDGEKNGEGGEKDITEYERANSWRFRWGGHYVKVPQHLGPFSVIKYAGNNIYRAMVGQITPEEAVKNVANEIATIGTHFTGTGEHGFGKGSPSLTASLMPSAIVQPLVQVGMNEDYKGAKIYREHEMGGAKYDPDWKYAKKDTSWAAVQISKMLNRLPFTGGSDNRKGIASVPPETLEYLSKQIVKNFGTDVINSVVETPVAIARSISEGENVAELKNTPFARDFYKKTPDVRGRYYDAMEEIEAQQNEFKKMPPQEKSAYIKEHPNAAGRLVKLQDKIKHLSALSQGMSMNAHGSKREVPNMSQKQKDMYEKSMLKLMAEYVRLANVN